MTNFYDFNVEADEEVIETLEKFGFEGACIFYDSAILDENKEETLKKFNMLNESTKLKLYNGVYIRQTNPQILSKLVLKYHRKSDIIMVQGGRDNINRTACQMPQVDIINEPYTSNTNSGINHILSRMLVENNITININYKSILQSRGYYKSRILGQINQLFALQKKYAFSTLISSGSKSFYDVRSPEAMLELGNLFETEDDVIRNSLTENAQNIIDNIQRKKDSVVDGVRIIR